MPRIKEYTSQVGGPQELPLSQVSRQAFASDFSGAGVGASIAGRGLQQVAEDGVAIQRMIDDQKARKEVTDVAVELARFNASAAHELKNAETSGALDDEAFTETYMSRISTNMDLVGQKFETAAGRQAWERGAAEMTGHYLIAAGESYSKAAGIKAVSQAKDFVDVSRNTLMNDPFQFERVEQGVANAINDKNGVFAHMPANIRDEFLRTTKTELAKSAVQGVIRLDPNIAMKQLNSDQWDPYLDADAKHALQTEARVGIAGLEAEARRREAEAERLRKKEIEATNQQMVEHYSTKSLTAPMILNSNLPATGEGSKEHWIKMVEAQNKEHNEAPIKKDPRLFVDTLQQIRQGKITSTTQIETLFAQSAERGAGITWEDTKQLRQEFVDMRTPEGAKLGAQVDAFLTSRKPMIDKSNPMMGKIDMTGGIKYYEYLSMVQDRVAEYKRDGKDPRTLLDPKSPDFLGAPEIVNQYRPTLKESAEAVAEDFKRGREAKPPTANGSSKLFDWLKNPFESEAPKKEPAPAPGAKPIPQSSPVPKQSTQEMRTAIADLEKSVKTMKGVEPVIVGPRQSGESAADYLKRWNEAHTK